MSIIHIIGLCKANEEIPVIIKHEYFYGHLILFYCSQFLNIKLHTSITSDYDGLLTGVSHMCANSCNPVTHGRYSTSCHKALALFDFPSLTCYMKTRSSIDQNRTFLTCQCRKPIYKIV